MRILEDLTKSCNPCKHIQHGPRKFRVKLGTENFSFNERIFIDIMYLDGDLVLHFVDDGTRFSPGQLGS